MTSDPNGQSIHQQDLAWIVLYSALICFIMRWIASIMLFLFMNSCAKAHLLCKQTLGETWNSCEWIPLPTESEVNPRPLCSVNLCTCTNNKICILLTALLDQQDAYRCRNYRLYIVYENITSTSKCESTTHGGPASTASQPFWFQITFSRISTSTGGVVSQFSAYSVVHSRRKTTPIRIFSVICVRYRPMMSEFENHVRIYKYWLDAYNWSHPVARVLFASWPD